MQKHCEPTLSQSGTIRYQQQYEEAVGNPFLRDFVLEARGVVLYPIDLPHKGRDTNALLLLARMLPATLGEIEFRPIPAAYHWRFSYREILTLCQGLAHEQISHQDLDASVKLKLQQFSTTTPEQDRVFELPDKGPIVIIGRPEFLMPHLQEEKEEDNLQKQECRGPLHHLLSKAGYPGRYKFVVTKPFERERGFRAIRDSLTGAHYQSSRPGGAEANEWETAGPGSRRITEGVPTNDLEERESRCIDYAVVHHNRVQHPVKRSVTIIAGTSSLGTWAATVALTDPDMLQTFGIGKLQESPLPIEILVRVTTDPMRNRPLDLRLADIHVFPASLGFRREVGDVDSLLARFKGEQIPGPDNGFSDLYDVEPHCKEGSDREIKIRPCDYPLGECVQVDDVNAEMVGGVEVREWLERLKKIAMDDYPVLITAASGTGKELAALLIKWYHDEWLRSTGKIAADEAPTFLAVNCAAISETLMLSELFGHVKGAFTGAEYTQPGILAAAGEGVVCLDEIGELKPALQTTLLRALQVRKVRAVGSTVSTPYDAKVVALTNRDLLASIPTEASLANNARDKGCCISELAAFSASCL